MLKIINDPFGFVLLAAYELWPELKTDIQWNPELDIDKKEYGCTIFPDDGGTPLIELNPGLVVMTSVEILAHELAHVAVGAGVKHGPEWEKAFNQIFQKYLEIFEEAMSGESNGPMPDSHQPKLFTEEEIESCNQPTK